MKKRLIAIAIGFAVVITAIILISRASQPPMPVYQGKTAEQWLDLVFTLQQSDGLVALRHMGTNCFPIFIAELQKKDSLWDKLNRALYPHLPASLTNRWTRPVNTNEQSAKWSGIEMVLINHPQIKQVLPDLAHTLEIPGLGSHEIVLWLVAMSVRSNDVECVPALIHEIETTNDSDVAWALMGLQNIGPSAKAAVPKLTTLLKDSNMSNRVRAAWALWMIGHDSTVVKPVLKAALDSPDFALREQIPIYLSEVDPADQSVIPLLINEISSTNQGIGQGAVIALRKYESAASNAVPAMIQQIEHGSSEMRRISLFVLKNIDAKAAAKYDNPVTGQSN